MARRNDLHIKAEYICADLSSRPNFPLQSCGGPYISVLAEERNVSRVAKRLLFSQPAVSRALQRVRDTFHDDLLVRALVQIASSPFGYSVILGSLVLG